MHEANSTLPRPGKEIKFSDKDIERFNSKLNKLDNGCWEWSAGLDKDGYGKFWLDRREIRSHRAAWLFHTGSIAGPDVFVCHKCDNPKCCNPDHLFAGTSRDNINDMVAKGRALSGERNNSSSLTGEQVDEIRRLYATGKHASRKLAKQFNSAKSTILRIIHGHTWKYREHPVDSQI